MLIAERMNKGTGICPEPWPQHSGSHGQMTIATVLSLGDTDSKGMEELNSHESQF